MNCNENIAKLKNENGIIVHEGAIIGMQEKDESKFFGSSTVCKNGNNNKVTVADGSPNVKKDNQTNINSVNLGETTVLSDIK